MENDDQILLLSVATYRVPRFQLDDASLFRVKSPTIIYRREAPHQLKILLEELHYRTRTVCHTVHGFWSVARASETVPFRQARDLNILQV
ncbi:hypothetical protein QQP08_013858 [Theobroma cacao]|nr:hypothetical protein QQP08_013858 [Theobroma cacao]